MYERSMRSKEEFEKKKEVLKDKVRQSDEEELGYDDLITDLTELFLSGEDIPRNPESVGSSSKSITTLFWNLGNWNRGLNFRVPAELDYKKLHYKEMNPERYPDHVPEDNNLFQQLYVDHGIRDLQIQQGFACRQHFEMIFFIYYYFKIVFNHVCALFCIFLSIVFFGYSKQKSRTFMEKYGTQCFVLLFFSKTYVKNSGMSMERHENAGFCFIVFVKM